MNYKIHMYQADMTGCGIVRVELVAKYLRKMLAEQVEVTTSTHATFDQVAVQNGALITPNCDLVVHQRQYRPENLNMLKYLRWQLGIPAVYELDDSLHHLHPSNPAYSSYASVEVKTCIENYIRECNAMTVTTEYMKKIYSKFNKNIYVLPNCIDYDLFNDDAIQKHDHGDEIWLGWSGSVSHIADLDIIVDAVKKILHDFPKTKLALGGFDGHYTSPNGKPRYVWDGIPYNRIVKIHWVYEPKNYPRLLSHFDIALAPLTDTVFNRCKSNLKFLDFGACGIPIIASSVEPYSTTIKNGETGILIPTATKSKKESLSKLWYDAIKSLILNVELRRKLAENAKLFVKQNYDMSVRVYDWFEVYKEIIERNKHDKQ